MTDGYHHGFERRALGHYEELDDPEQHQQHNYPAGTSRSTGRKTSDVYNADNARDAIPPYTHIHRF